MSASSLSPCPFNMTQRDLILFLIDKRFTPDEAIRLVRYDFVWALRVYNEAKRMDRMPIFVKGREIKTNTNYGT